MQIMKNVRNFLYAHTHASALLNRSRSLSRSVSRYKVELEAVRVRLANTESLYLERNAECNAKRHEVDQLRQQVPALKAVLANALETMGDRNLSVEQKKAFYRAAAPYLDKAGFELFWTAEEILGKFCYSFFAYEDNCHCFDDADGSLLLRYLLVQHGYMLGDANADRNRWEPAFACYEKCVDFTIDTTTPEYLAFEAELYTRVLERMEILTPVDTKAKEAAA